MDRDDLIAEEFVSHETTTGSNGHETAEDTGTTEHEQPAEGDTVAHTTDEVEAPPAHLGNYGGTPLGVHVGVVAPAVCCVVIDGAPWEGHYSPVPGGLLHGVVRRSRSRAAHEKELDHQSISAYPG
jgi:hypothetical protein